MIETTKLDILKSVWMSDYHSVSHLYEKSKTSVSIFSQIKLSIRIECTIVATICWFVEARAKFILHKYCSRERTLLTWFYEICVYHRSYVRTLVNGFVSNFV